MLLNGMISGNVSHLLDLNLLMVRLGPEARREMGKPMLSFGLISNAGGPS